MSEKMLPPPDSHTPTRLSEALVEVVILTCELRAFVADMKENGHTRRKPTDERFRREAYWAAEPPG